jgi:hypothetical protein
VVVVISVAMPPGPVFFLLLGRDVPEVAAFVIVVFPRPLVLVNDFVVVPNVVIAIVRVVYPVGVMGAGQAKCRTRQGYGQEGRTEKLQRFVGHSISSL